MRIGITANFFHPSPDRELFPNKRLMYFEQGLAKFFAETGAAVLGIPHPGILALLEPIVRELDGIVLAGGADVAPESYGETPHEGKWPGDRYQDEYDLAIIRLALARQKPILGICRGCQILNVAFGGTLHQDLLEHNVAKFKHRDRSEYDRLRHDVTIEPGTRLSRLYPSGGAVVSVHHQAVKDLGKSLRVAARSEDGIVEAIEADGDAFVVGVQWHPEWGPAGEKGLLDPGPLLDAFLRAARK